MLEIRQDQVQALDNYMLRQFEDRMVSRFQNGPQERPITVGNGGLRMMIQAGIERAIAYGVNLEEDVQQYLEWVTMYGLDFDTRAETSWSGEILRRQDIDGTTKISEIRHKWRQP